ncbi:MAG: hypothetical protein IPI69_16145 [Bacteroidales bacterium]|nr:hypothetical protein [Bacteroidales bacterium]
MITAFGDVELAVRAVKEGAFDFCIETVENSKPFWQPYRLPSGSGTPARR